MSCCATARSSNDRKSHRRGEHCYTHKSTKAFRCIMILDYYSLREYICTFFLQAGPLSLCQCGTQRYKEGYFLKFSFRCRAKKSMNYESMIAQRRNFTVFVYAPTHSAKTNPNPERRTYGTQSLYVQGIKAWRYEQMALQTAASLYICKA